MHAIFLSFLWVNQSFGDSTYGAVFNDGLSKMEMIEKIDGYISGPLMTKISSIEQKLMSIEGKTQSDIVELRQKIEIIDKRLESIESKLGEKSNSQPTEVKRELLDYLKDLKSVIIPAIQKKLLDNENQLINFIQQSTAKLETEKLIRSELESNSQESEVKELEGSNE